MKAPIRLAGIALGSAVLAAATIGLVTGTDEAMAATPISMRIPGAAFNATNNVTPFYNNGDYVRNSHSFTGYFAAPVILEGNSATIHSIRLHYLDDGADEICVVMYRSNMKAGGSAKKMSSMCTKNAADKVRTKTDLTIKPAAVGIDNAVNVYVKLPPGVDYRLYGVTIVYTPFP